MRYLVPIALTLFLPLCLTAGESPGGAAKQLVDDETVFDKEPREFQAILYNQHPSAEGKPQFRRRPVGRANERIQNGGLGDGFSDSYFCGGGDEAYAYRASAGSFVVSANEGTYNSIVQEDTCRTEGGCGNVQPDNKCFIYSLPSHATNCHPLGQMKAWDAPAYENFEDTSPSAPRYAGHPGWAGRNYIEDEYGFLFGRYLINQVDCPSPEASSAPVDYRMEVIRFSQSPDQYSPLKYNRPFLDIPYSLNHLKWGFTCGVLSWREAYRANPVFRTFFGGVSEPADEGEEMDDQHVDHYKTLLAMATNRLCNKIGDGTFGNVTDPTTTNEKEMREVVVPICQVLRTMIDRIPGDCAGQGCDFYRGLYNLARGKFVDMRVGRTAPGTFIEFRPEQGAIFLEQPVYDDCHSKRASNSHPHYNIEGEIGGRCRPSYGEWVDGGLYEPLYGTDRGFEVTYSGSGASRRIQAHPGGYVPVGGYSPVVIARLAHELIHAYNYQERGETLKDYPLVPREEITAVLGQALVYYYLCDLGFCPKNFGAQMRPFVRSHTATDAIRGYRFLYPHECRGYEGIYLGPFCTNMFAMAKWLGVTGDASDRRPEVARMLALWHANAPTLKTPLFRTVHGVESAFGYLPMRGPRGDSQQRFVPDTMLVTPPPAGIQTQESGSGGIPPGGLSDSPFPPADSPSPGSKGGFNKGGARP